MILEVEHPTFGKVREVNTPVRFSGSKSGSRRVSNLGEDTLDVLTNYLHYSDAEINALRQAGAI